MSPGWAMMSRIFGLEVQGKSGLELQVIIAVKKESMGQSNQARKFYANLANLG